MVNHSIKLLPPGVELERSIS